MQTLRWYANRLARMSGGEIVHRLAKTGRACVARSGLGERAPPPPPDGAARGVRFLQASAAVESARYVARAERILAGRIDIFDLADHPIGHPPRWNRDPLTGREAPLTHAAFLDYRDERLVGDIKYLWEPNRHLQLPALAQAHLLTGERRWEEGLRLQIGSWIAQCPPGRGANWTSALELGIRLINWSLAWQLLDGAAPAAPRGSTQAAGFEHLWLDSVYRHARAIAGDFSRYSSANNHLIGEAAGVFIAALTWPLWPEMRVWGARSRAILERETLAQNAPDGGNREQAVAYQQFVLDFLLYAGLAARAAGEDFPDAWWRRVESMIEFVASLMDAGGHVPMIGDADDGFVARLSAEEDFCPFRSLVATGALLFGRGDLARRAGRLDDKSRWLIGGEADARFAALLESGRPWRARRAFPDSGYWILCDSEGTDAELRLLIDAGPLGYLSLAAHGHADALALLLSVGGREVLVDPGTFTYHTRPEWRRWFRGTAAHNTVTVDGRDQSEQAGNFMWSQHARAHCTEFAADGGRQVFIGEHDGYRRLADPVVHRRRVELDERERRFVVSDTLECAATHRIARQWQFAADLEPRIAVDGSCEVRVGRFILSIVPVDPLDAAATVRGGAAGQGGWVSRSFGTKSPATLLRWENRIGGTTCLRTEIRCRPEP